MKNCPFCGNGPLEVVARIPDENIFKVLCHGCGAMGPEVNSLRTKDFEKEAVGLWDERHGVIKVLKSELVELRPSDELSLDEREAYHQAIRDVSKMIQQTLIL